MLAGIREILVITTPQDLEAFKRLLGDGEKYGVSFSFETQKNANGIAEAFRLAEHFVGKDSCSLILGDNLFYGVGLGKQLREMTRVDGARIFAYKVQDPKRYGVVEFDNTGKVLSIEEKPERPRSSFAVPGLYFYDNDVIEIAKNIKPSSRGELEITDVNNVYLEKGKLHTTILERGTAWLDTGTFESLNAATAFIRIIEERQGLKISCLEEVAWRNGWISDSELLRRAEEYKSSPFADYLQGLLS
jgi:glucose-1-phosphate thymidylyltransferase